MGHIGTLKLVVEIVGANWLEGSMIGRCNVEG